MDQPWDVGKRDTRVIPRGTISHPKMGHLTEARASAFLKARMKEVEITYAELAKLKKHGFKDETEAGITMKLKRGTFTATFFMACVAALELEEVVLDEL